MEVCKVVAAKRAKDRCSSDREQESAIKRRLQGKRGGRETAKKERKEGSKENFSSARGHNNSRGCICKEMIETIEKERGRKSRCPNWEEKSVGSVRINASNACVCYGGDELR